MPNIVIAEKMRRIVTGLLTMTLIISCGHYSNDYYRLEKILMRTYRRKHGLTTIRGIINRFAPPSENNTEKYVRYCCTVTLKGSMEPITNRATYYVLGQAMARMETGTGLSYDVIASVANKFNIRIIA